MTFPQQSLPGLFSFWRGVVCVAVLLLAACSSSPNTVAKVVVAESSSVSLDQLLSESTDGPGGELVALAQQQLGRPYRYGGTTPKGFDCSGLVYYVHRSAGFKVPRTSRDQYRRARKVSLKHIVPGDLVFFKESSAISHVGIYVTDTLFIHSPSGGKGVSYASLNEKYWQKRLVGAGRFF